MLSERKKAERRVEKNKERPLKIEMLQERNTLWGVLFQPKAFLIEYYIVEILVAM